MDKQPKLFKRTRERQYSAHHDFIHIAKLQLEVAKAEEPGWYNASFIAIAFSSLAIEALANAFGEHVIEDWGDFENSSPGAKLRIIADRLDIPYEAKGEPWHTIRWLGQFRNKVAHAKPETVVEERLIGSESAQTRPLEPPESKLERQVTVENAERAVEMVERLKRLFAERLPPEDRFGLDLGGWSATTEPVVTPRDR